MLDFTCQHDAIKLLYHFADRNLHSILIHGTSGTGKTYLAKQYAKLLNITDFQIIDPTVSSIRSAVCTCLNFNTPVVLCIENLDSGVVGASYALLKFLEEPSQNVYIVITAQSLSRILDTIQSRSTIAEIYAPRMSDINDFAKSLDIRKFEMLQATKLWKAVKTFTDISTVFAMSDSQVQYIQSLESFYDFKDPISTIVWNLGHYPDSTDTPVRIVLQYLISLAPNLSVIRAGSRCLEDLSSNRLSQYAIISRFALECKYCE